MMKKLLLFIIVLMIVPSLALAATDVNFAWNANTEPDLAGYRLYRSNTSGVYTFGEINAVAIFGAVATTGTETDVPDGTWYWVLTAFDTEGNESGPSNEVTVTLDTIAPLAPSGLAITGTVKK